MKQKNNSKTNHKNPHETPLKSLKKPTKSLRKTQPVPGNFTTKIPAKPTEYITKNSPYEPRKIHNQSPKIAPMNPEKFTTKILAKPTEYITKNSPHEPRKIQLKPHCKHNTGHEILSQTP